MARSGRNQFKRRIFGYRRRDVEAHLESVDSQIAELRATIDEREGAQADLVLRATRQTVEQVLVDAHAEAGRILETAEAEAASFADRAVIDLTQTPDDGTNPDSELFAEGDEAVADQA